MRVPPLPGPLMLANTDLTHTYIYLHPHMDGFCKVFCAKCIDSLQIRTKFVNSGFAKYTRSIVAGH